MSVKPIVSHPTGNGQNGQAPSIESRAFVVAFIPPTQSNITHAWSLKASEAINRLIDFRSAIHRWQATGTVDESEFTREVQALEDSGLAGWVDELIAAGMLEALR